MLSARAREVLRRAEFDGDVLLGWDGALVDESGLVAPLEDGLGGCGKERLRAADELGIQHLTELSDGGTDLYGFRRRIAVARLGVSGPNEGKQFAGLQSRGLMGRDKAWFRRNKNGEL